MSMPLTCDHCGHAIAPRDHFPVVWLSPNDDAAERRVVHPACFKAIKAFIGSAQGGPPPPRRGLLANLLGY